MLTTTLTTSFKKTFSKNVSTVLLNGACFASCLLHQVIADDAAAADPAAAMSYQAAVDAAYAEAKTNTAGANADYIPALAEVPSDLFGVAVATADGAVFTAGDVDYAFSIQSVSKPFTMALVMEQQGVAAIREKIGVEPTGQAFNSIMAIEMHPARSINPLVNAGAIAAVSMIDAATRRRVGSLLPTALPPMPVPSCRCFRTSTNQKPQRISATQRLPTCCRLTVACTRIRWKASMFTPVSVRWG